MVAQIVDGAKGGVSEFPVGERKEGACARKHIHDTNREGKNNK
jgi:hypothetical protein